VVTMEDAWLFPVVCCYEIVDIFSSNNAYKIGSIVLFGLFLVIKYFGREWINWVLGWYFSLAGVGSVFRVRLLEECSLCFTNNP
jgi:minor histocompatibility antigen H13